MLGAMPFPESSMTCSYPTRNFCQVIFLVAALCLACVSSTQSSAQDAAPPSRPDTQPQLSGPPAASRKPVGLALSGGGALGLAHIGVLRWLEEHHIPVDRIAGTSMGGIIAALYATGRSPAEIEKFAEDIDWDQALLPEPDYDQLSFRRKQDRRNYQIAAALGLKHGFRGPNGFSAGHGVGLLLDRFALPYSGIASFDDLPIPFRCVATDMLNGDEVVLENGSLADAVRATMAIPGVFSPVEINGHVLADGGMVENIPVSVVRNMHADVVIAVELRVPIGGRDDLDSLTGVLSRALSVVILQNERRSLAASDATVTVDVGKLTATNYSKVKELIQLGYDAADRQAPALLQYQIADDAQWHEYLEARLARKRPAINQVKTVVVEGADRDEDRRIAEELHSVTEGALNLPRLETQLTRIAGEGAYDRLGYEGFVQNGVPSLRITAHDKTYGPPFVDLAVNVNGSGVAAFDFSAGARVTFMDVRHHGGEWRNDLLLGSSNLFATEFYQPIAGTGFFVAPFAFASKTARNAFTGQQRVAIFGDERAGGGMDIGYNTGRRSEMRLGYQIFSGRLAPLVGSAGLPTASGSTGEFRLRYVWDGQDSPAVPSRGLRITTSLTRVLQSPRLVHPLDQAELQTSTFIPLGGKNSAVSRTSLFITASGGTTFQGVAGPLQVFTLGGPFRLGAYLPEEFLGNHYAFAAVGFRRELFQLPPIVGKKIYWGGWYESGTAFNRPGPIVVRGSLNLGVIADTILGPILLGGSISPTGKARANFSVGRLF